MTATSYIVVFYSNSTQPESVSSTARLELTQPIDSFDTVALKDSEQVNDGLDMLESNLKTNISRTSRVSCIVS